MYNFIKGTEAIEGMMAGVTAVTDLIRPTYGGGGTNVVIESALRPGHLVANDAQTIVQAVKVESPAEKRGVAFIQELCDKADKISGDARKTTIILAEEILKAGYKTEINKLELKRELDKLIPFIENEINLKHTRQISVEEVENVATTASESSDTGKLLQSIYREIGKDGIIQPEGSGTYETSFRIIDGVRLDMCGFLSPSMANQDKQAIYEKPLVLITKKKIATDDDINPLLREMIDMEDKRALIIFTQDMDSSVATMLVDLHKSGRLNVCIIKAPTLWRDYVFEDFANCVGATIIEDSTGKTFKNMQLSDLGTCDRIIVDGDETILTGIKDISKHISYLESKGDNDSKLRLSWLTNKTAILKLGANSETDLSYKRLKCNDAIRSSRLALKYGIVEGGGCCLSNIADTLPETEAGKIMKQALKAPHIQILKNTNAPITTDIVDASMVVKMAVRNAIGIASTILTANGIIYIPKLTSEEMNYQIAMNKQNAF